MVAALMVVAPRGLAGAVSPVMLSDQTVILAGRDSATLPRRPHLDASLDLVLGAVLLAVAEVVHALGGRLASGHRAPRRARAAFPFGVFSMATNVTTLALLVPAAKEIATADVTIAGRVALVLVVVSLISMPVWLPVAVTRLAPGARAARARLRRRPDRRARARRSSWCSAPAACSSSSAASSASSRAGRVRV